MRSLKKLFNRLVIPYFIWTIIIFSIKSLTSGLQNNPVEIKDLLLSPIVPFEEFWFLYIMFLIQMIYILLHNICNPYGKEFFFLLSFIFCLIKPFVVEFWVVDYLLRFMIFYSLGTLLEKSVKSEKRITSLGMVISFFLFFLANVISVKWVNKWCYSIRFYYYTFVFAICALLLLYLFGIKIMQLNNPIKSKKILVIIGRNSMIVYCIHPIILGFLRVNIYKIIDYSNITFQVIFISIVTVLCCYSALIIAEKFKIDKMKLYQIAFGRKS